MTPGEPRMGGGRAAGGAPPSGRAQEAGQAAWGKVLRRGPASQAAAARCSRSLVPVKAGHALLAVQ